MHSFNPNQGLPVPCTEVDPRWFNNNLPQGNDCVPPIQLSQWMQANQQVGLMTIGLVRAMAQAAANKSQTHCFVYNLLCQNGFQNQIWQQWAQTAVDFCEVLILMKNYQPQAAVNKAAQCTVEACMGVAFHTYPVLQQVTPNNFWPGLQAAQQMYQQMVTDIRDLRSGNFNNGMPNNNWNGGSHGNLPQINMGGQHQYSGYQNHSNSTSQVTGSAYVSNHHQPQQHNGHVAASGEVQNSLYDVPSNEPVKPMVVKEEIGTDYFGNVIHKEPAPMQTFTQSNVTQQETSLPIPTKISEVVVDPTYYQPTGFKLDINRAYDLIWNPGGIEIRPAQLTDWEITVGDDAPWVQLMDPTLYCTFLVKFPDGTVKEKFVEWTDAMNYLRHELDVELRRKAYRPNGIVVSSNTPISTIGGDAMKATEIESLVKDGHLKRSAVPPVILPVVFQGSTDLEVESQVREDLSNLLEVNFNDEIPMPACEYRSQFTHTLPITFEAFKALSDLRVGKDLGQTALGLREMTAQGVISIRVLHALNDRLTKTTNGLMADSMGLSVQIDDFCEDYLQLEDYILKNRGEPMLRTLQGAAEAILNRALTLMATDNGEEGTSTIYHVVDNYINHQLGWDLADLATLNLKSGKPALISVLAHPVILETLKGMIARANEAREEFVGVLRLITRDGFYLEVLKGRLVANAILLKLVR